MRALDRAAFIVIRETTCACEPAGTAAPAIAGSSDAPTREQIVQAMGGVLDPELGMSVVELGLIYDIEIVNGAVTITMTLTAPGCPVHDVMPAWIRQALMAVPGVEAVDVRITFDPPWTPERIKLGPENRALLG
jgi:metal-sulfur cluster biosynthetic enzyme